MSWTSWRTQEAVSRPPLETAPFESRRSGRDGQGGRANTPADGLCFVFVSFFTSASSYCIHRLVLHSRFLTTKLPRLNFVCPFLLGRLKGNNDQGPYEGRSRVKELRDREQSSITRRRDSRWAVLGTSITSSVVHMGDDRGGRRRAGGLDWSMLFESAEGCRCTKLGEDCRIKRRTEKKAKNRNSTDENKPE